MKTTAIRLLLVLVLALTLLPSQVFAKEEVTLFKGDLATTFYGKPSESAMQSTLHYLFPREIHELDLKILDNLIKDPNLPYYAPVSKPEASMFYYVGQVFFPLFAQLEIHYAYTFEIPSLLLSMDAYEAMGEDEVGLLRAIYLEGLKSHRLNERFF